MDNRRRGTVAAAAGVGVALLLAGCGSGTDKAGSSAASTGPVTLTITTNAIAGGKNAAEADWIQNYVIPTCGKELSTADRKVTVKFLPSGVDDDAYKTKISLDLKSSSGADIIGLDGIWLGEFAQAGYIKPLSDIVGGAVDKWDGWSQIPKAVQGSMSYDGKVYGVPTGADGRFIYYNKTLFAKAGLPTDWQPKSWDDILAAARKLKTLNGVTPIQLNAGTAMGEATTMQGILPMLAGAGSQIWQDGKWQGDTKAVNDVLKLYKTIYVDEKLGDPVLQQEANGRDQAFQEFADNQIGILFEGDYFWRSVVNPDKSVGTAPMADRDSVVGYAKIPAETPGSGVKGQDYVSLSGGAGRVINPNTKNPDLAWKLMECMNSKDAYVQRVKDAPAITPRNDVNAEVLGSDKLLSWVSDEILPITIYRPGLAEYNQVSSALQEATDNIVSGKSVKDAASDYAKNLKTIVGEKNVKN